MDFIRSIGITSDTFLENFSPNDRNRLIGAFAHATRENTGFSTRPGNQVQSSSVKAALDAVSATYREYQCPDPCRDSHNQKHVFLERQLKGYTNEDQATRSQKALPPKVL